MLLKNQGITSRIIAAPREELDAEHDDPYVMGWEAGENLDEPPPCPYKDGVSCNLWRKGFSARVDEYIRKTRISKGLNASLCSD